MTKAELIALIIVAPFSFLPLGFMIPLAVLAYILYAHAAANPKIPHYKMPEDSKDTGPYKMTQEEWDDDDNWG